MSLIVCYFLILFHLLDEEVVDHDDELQVSWQYLLEDFQIPAHRELLHRSLALKRKALGGQYECLMKSKLEIINQNPEHLKYANRMVHVKKVQSNFVWKSLPIRLVLLMKLLKISLSVAAMKKYCCFKTSSCIPSGWLGSLGYGAHVIFSHSFLI